MAEPDRPSSFKPALLIVDVQEDFCPPHGSLAVDGGREIAPIINELLSLPFELKIATRDCHPADHISFASLHPSPHNVPFSSTAKITNPSDQTQSYAIPLWPSHCVQGTPGFDIIPEISCEKIDRIVNKGRDRSLEMFSGFADVFGRKSSEAVDLDLAKLLHDHKITHVYTVGLAGDYCVKCTSLDARKEGFEVILVEAGVRSVNPGPSGWGDAKKQMESVGICIVDRDSKEIDWVKQLRPSSQATS